MRNGCSRYSVLMRVSIYRASRFCNRYLVLCVCVASLFIGLPEAAMNSAECGEEIAGCGVGVGTEQDDQWCNCLSSLDADIVQLSFNLFCG